MRVGDRVKYIKDESDVGTIVGIEAEIGIDEYGDIIFEDTDDDRGMIFCLYRVKFDKDDYLEGMERDQILLIDEQMIIDVNDGFEVDDEN